MQSASPPPVLSLTDNELVLVDGVSISAVARMLGISSRDIALRREQAWI